MGLFQSLLKETGNEFASVVQDGTDADVDGYVNTGSYALNALLSGDVFGGMPNNKVTALAGEPSTGKTFYALNIARQFLQDNQEGGVFYFESESAITKDMMESRGIDTSRVFLLPVTTIQEFRTQAVRILDKYLEEKESDRKPIMMVLDSLGMLSTQKEVSDIAEGKDTRDMTRAQLVRGAFRVLTLKLGRAKVPMIITNHVYDVVGSYIPTKKMGGGDGLTYAASTIIFLSKKKEKQGVIKESTIVV
jgi:RecA/RadA recombinase